MDSENRLRERHVYNKYILCYKCYNYDPSSKPKVPFVFNVTDISFGGMGITTEQRLSVGTVLSFRLSEDELSRVFTVEVIWCKESSNIYKLGVEFKDIVKEDIIFLHTIVKGLD